MRRWYIFYVISKCGLLFFLILVMVACEYEHHGSENFETEFYTQVNVPVLIDISDFCGERLTRSDGSLLPGDMGEEENVIHNLTVFQFNGEGEADDPLVVLRYIDTNPNNLLLGLMQPKIDVDKNQFIYVVANAGTQLQNFTGTFGQLKQQLLPVNELSVSNGFLIMTASLTTQINSLIPLRMKFIRSLAKVNVTCSVAPGIAFTPVRLQIKNVPKSLNLVNTTVTTPEAESSNFQNYQSLTENVSSGYTWYIPENIRGTGNADNPKNKTEITAPSGQGQYCTYVELSGLYQKESTTKLISYKVYLGNDNQLDYNVISNNIYNVDLNIVGINETDRRITVETLPTPMSPANCYMVSAGEVVLINLLEAPGLAVSGSGVDYVTQVGSLSSPNIKSLGVVWQTENTADGLIQDLTYLETIGQAMFKVTPGASGNLLLAAYSEPKQKGEILWSWHIWITDYDVSSGISGEVPGGNIYTLNGVTWMDRDLGALTATPGIVTTIGYAYQWGRKDPLPLSNSISSFVARPMYDKDGNYLWSGTIVQGKTISGNSFVSQSLAEPWIMYSNWPGGYSLWQNDTKTMFDPCPAGWRLPSYNDARSTAGSNFTVNSSLKGAYYRSTMWYQFCGYINTAGVVPEVGGTSVYWSTGTGNGQGYMYQLRSRSSDVGLRGLSYGFIGRCVKQ